MARAIKVDDTNNRRTLSLLLLPVNSASDEEKRVMFRLQKCEMPSTLGRHLLHFGKTGRDEGGPLAHLIARKQRRQKGEAKQPFLISCCFFLQLLFALLVPKMTCCLFGSRLESDGKKKGGKLFLDARVQLSSCAKLKACTRTHAYTICVVNARAWG